MRQKSHFSREQLGFSLIEVLVSIVVLTFGLLGTVGMQLSSLQGNRDASLQSSAVRFGRELAELMRDNKNIALRKGAAENPYLIDFTGGGSLQASKEDCFKITCSTDLEVANWGVQDWLARLDRELPGARVVVCFDSQPFQSSGLPQWECNAKGGVAVVKIGWTKRSLNSKDQGEAALDRARAPSVVLPVAPGAEV